MKTAYLHVHIVTVDADDREFPDGGLLYEDGRILAVGESADIETLAQAQGADCRDGQGKFLFPGLVNTHTHLYQELTKGLGSDLSLEEWFPTAMAPVGAALRPRHMEAGVALGLVEAIRSGVTTVADYMQHQPVPGLGRVELDIAAQMGVRMVYGRGYRDIGRREVIEGPDQIFADVEDLKSRYEVPGGMVTVWLAPAASWGVTEDLLRETRRYADATHTPIMMHLFETGSDESGSQKRFGKPAIQWLEENRFLGPDLLAVHSVALGEKELERYEANQVMVSYDPVSNMYLASGAAPIRALKDRGLTVGLGTDGAGSNNNNNMLEAMKSGALLQKVIARDPQAMTAQEMLRMATIDGAQALGLADTIGSIEPGKAADFFLFDPMASAVACPVCGSAAAALVYASDCRAVDTVVIAGRTVLEGSVLTCGDEKAILRRAADMAADLMAAMHP